MTTISFFISKITSLCKTDFCFVKTGGGQPILLLLFVLLGQPLFAQTPPEIINCGQLQAYVVAKSFNGTNDGGSCVPCCTGTYSCEKASYDVYLRVSDNGSGDADLPNFGEFDINFLELYLSMKLSRGTGSLLSTIENLGSIYCLNPALSDDDFNLMEDIATVYLSEGTLGNATDITFVDAINDSQCLAISKFPIFSIVVNAVAGESLGVECINFNYDSNGGGVCVNSVCSGIANATFPMPSSANNDFSLALGDIDCDMEEYVELPILVTSTLTSNIGSFDFIVLISTTAPDGFYAEPEYTSALGNPLVPNPTLIPGTQQYSVHLRSSGQNWSTFFGTNLLLGTLKIYRPPNLDQIYTISASLIPQRIRMTGGANIGCKSFSAGGSTFEICENGPPGNCADNYNIDITAEASLQNCSTLVSYVTLSWDPAEFGNSNSLSFTYIRALLDFELESGISITSANLVGMTCPSGTCLQITDHVVDLNMNAITPFTVNNNARIEVTFTGTSGCINDVTIRRMVISRTVGDPCIPDITINPSPLEACIPINDNYIKGDIATETGCWLEDVTVDIFSTLNPSGCSRNFLTGGLSGNFCVPYTSSCLCDLTTAGVYTVTPEKNDNPLNGVTTYDLVLIQKHILALEPLTSPYKMIAADVSRSSSITPFDVVEIRKLILGIYTEFPAVNSWLFVDKNHTFSSDPFSPAFPEEIGLSTFPDEEVDFVGVKMGDVNNSAIVECDDCDAFLRPDGTYPLLLSKKSALRAGDVYTLPIRAGGEEPIIAWQTAFRFDPAFLELIGPSIGDAQGLSADNFNLNLASEGLIRVLWFAEPDAWEETAIQPGQSLFNLTFRVKKDLPETGLLVQLDDTVMPNQAWTKEGSTLSLQTLASNTREEEPKPALGPLWIRCHPNPSQGAVTFDLLSLPNAGRAQLLVFDAFGRRVWHQHLSAVSAPSQITIPEAAAWPAGVYHWELRFDRQKSSGAFVRQ